MKNPIVLNKDQTCYNCSHFRLCHGRHQMLETIHVWNGHFDRNKTRPDTLIFAALAAVCVDFDYQPDPPPSDDEPQFVTLVLQIPHGESQALVTNLQAELVGHGATLHAPDMREVL